MEEKVKLVDSLDKIVIRLHRLSTYYKGTNLVRSQAHRYKNMIGRVLMVGSAVYKGETGCEYIIKDGDEVIFRDWGCLREIACAGKNQFLIHKDDLVGVIIR